MDPGQQFGAPGSVIAGKYLVRRTLGKGGMGVVVEAHHTQLDQRVALKFLLPEFAAKPEFAERFMREAKAAARIRSEHVARVIDVGTLENGLPFIVMEFLEGLDLSAWLKQKGQFALEEAVDYVLQACEAIGEAHQAGIVHRDIKPANLFIARGADGFLTVKVLDFGISKDLGAETNGLTQTTATMGSSLYMSPEQMRDAKSVDYRADIYSMGVTLFELLVGTQPYFADTLPELCMLILSGSPTPLADSRPDLPAGFAQVLERAYERDRDQRYQSVPELAFALAPYAPERAQHSLERIARLAGTRAPRAGAPAQPPVAAAPGVQLPAPREGFSSTSPNVAAGQQTSANLYSTQAHGQPAAKKSGRTAALVAVPLVALGVGAALAWGVYSSPAAGTSRPETPAAETPAVAAPPSSVAPLVPSATAPPVTSAVPSSAASVAPQAAPPVAAPPSTFRPPPPRSFQAPPTNAFDHR